MTTTRLTLLTLLALCACANAGSGPNVGPRKGEATDSPAVATASTTDSADKAADVAQPLVRRLHRHPMTEVVLDAHGTAALTLDDRGELRLWPDVQAEHSQVVGADEFAAPVALPDREPIWMSLARSDDGFVVATIDTGGTTRVARIVVGSGGEARRIALFELPATDPQFEIHVLDGGERILALGKDHRIRLYDAGGGVRSQIDEPGFIPWQLRVVETPGQPVALAAVLTQPVRAQGLTIEGDALTIVGEPWMVALDQSPNRNAMALSPDGTTIAALRRVAKGRGFALQLIELATGTRRVIVGDLDDKVMPRLHYAQNDRVLLETGTGTGWWVDLAQAVPRDAEHFPPAVLEPVALPGAPGELRMQVTLVAGVRAIADVDTLFVDPVAQPGHDRLTRQRLRGSVLALDGRGTTLAWSEGTRVFIETLGSGDAIAPRFDIGARVTALSFTEVGHLLVTTAAGTSLRGQDGAVVDGEIVRPPAPVDHGRETIAALPLRGRDSTATIAAPQGDLVAVRMSGPMLARSSTPQTPWMLGMFDAAQRAQLWTSPLGEDGLVAWSADGTRVALYDGVELAVLDARTGERLHARSDVGLAHERAPD